MSSEGSVADFVKQHGQSHFCVSIDRCCLVLNTNRNDSYLALSVPLSAFRRMGHGVGQRKAAEINLLKKLRKQEKSGQNQAI